MPVVAVLRERIEIEPALSHRGTPGIVLLYPSHWPEQDRVITRTHTSAFKGDPGGAYRAAVIEAAQLRRRKLRRYWMREEGDREAFRDLESWIEEEKQRCRS